MYLLTVQPISYDTIFVTVLVLDVKKRVGTITQLIKHEVNLVTKV